ncbi:hypothetical protein SAMN04515668_4866 [Hymenobacter arizonensis]|uniref:YD repeat-containing protein n=2 Tax=Hymenobacter arizonensis TaxID=1227077 RepID=A0A1I6BP35_HYMAR|nr:hypothetical protein SAMN04515668_4866 [Hymenobacter arizonensis]
MRPLFMLLFLLGVCWPPRAVRAQQTLLSFNPGPVWAGRLEPVGEAFYLPASQRGLQQATTYLVYHGQRYLMKAVRYDSLGRLAAYDEYQLDVKEGQLTRRLARHVTYRTQVSGDSLTSEVTENWHLTSSSYVREWRIKGSIPPTEPLLGKGAKAQPLQTTAPSRLLATMKDRDGNYLWTWTREGTMHGGPLSPSHRYYGQGVSGGFIDAKARRFRATAGRGNTSLLWERRYVGRSPNYVEEGRSSFFSSGGATDRQVYQRKVKWRNGWCRTEQFTAFGEARIGERLPQFTIRHHYTFYLPPRKGTVRPSDSAVTSNKK